MAEFKDVSENSLSMYHIGKCIKKWRINVFDDDKSVYRYRLWIYFLLYRASIVGSINQEYQIYDPLKLCRNIPGKRHKCTIPVGNLGPVQYKDAILPVYEIPLWR